MNLLLLIVIVTGVPAWIYFTTRLGYGKYTGHGPDTDSFWDWGWSEYHPGHLRPIHFLKAVCWNVAVFGGIVALYAFLWWASRVTV